MILFNLINKIIFFNKLKNFLYGLSAQVLLILGISIIMVTFGFSISYIPTKILAMTTSSIGSIFGTFFITFGLRERDKCQKNINKEDLLKEIEIENKITDYNRINLDNENLSREIYELKNRRLKTEYFESIYELGVAKAEMSGTNYELFTEKKNEAIIGRDQQFEYLGIYDYKYTAKIGIDLKKLKIKDIDENTIEISGVKPEVLGNLNQSINPKLTEIRITKDNSIFTGKTKEILDNHSKLNTYKDNQYSNIQNAINIGSELNSFNDYIMKLTENFLKLFLTPLNKKHINFVSEERNNAVSLTDYFHNYNKTIDNKIQEKENIINKISS